jgi:hypothetical protein
MSRKNGRQESEVRSQKSGARSQKKEEKRRKKKEARSQDVAHTFTRVQNRKVVQVTEARSYRPQARGQEWLAVFWLLSSFSGFWLLTSDF